MSINSSVLRKGTSTVGEGSCNKGEKLDLLNARHVSFLLLIQWLLFYFCQMVPVNTCRVRRFDLDDF